MNFIYEQINLHYDDELQSDARTLLEIISAALPHNASNGFARLLLPNASDINYAAVLERLRDGKIILFDYWQNDYGDDGCTVAIINRYKYNMLEAELDWLARPEEEKGPDDDSGPYADDLVYYDKITGELLFNGVYKKLKGRNKKLFDILFDAAPDYRVSKPRLLKIILTGKHANDPPESAVSEAFTNLRKVCGVRAHSIPAAGDGSRYLDADTYPMSAQFPRYWHGFDQYRSKSRKELLDTSVSDPANT